MYYKKLISLNPDTYSYITEHEAHKEYKEYVFNCTDLGYRIQDIKDFDIWLLTEI